MLMVGASQKTGIQIGAHDTMIASTALSLGFRSQHWKSEIIEGLKHATAGSLTSGRRLR